MFGIYSCCNIIVLLNMLIAMMSNSYQSISVNNDRLVSESNIISILNLETILLLTSLAYAYASINRCSEFCHSLSNNQLITYDFDL